MFDLTANIQSKSAPCKPRNTIDDDDDDDDDSLLDSFRYINGRRYHNDSDVSYLLPNDEDEADRLDLQHSLLRYAWQGNHSSPVHDLLATRRGRVLDIGCGTGKWILEMAKDYPASTFIGLDISPIFPDPSGTPSNVAFLQCNVSDRIPFPDNTFDFVFQRLFSKYVTAEQWEQVAKEMVRVTKPGGWVEFFEDDIEYEEIDAFGLQVLDGIFAAIEAKHGNPHPYLLIPPILQTMDGLSKIYYKKVSIPIGPWGGKLGEMMSRLHLKTFQNFALIMTSSLGISNETHDVIGDVVARGFEINKVSSATFRWYAQKGLG